MFSALGLAFTTLALIIVYTESVSLPSQESEVSDLENVLSQLRNLTSLQKEVLLQQEQHEKEMKNRHKLEEEQELSRTQALEAEQHVLKEMRGQISRKLKTITRNSNGNQHAIVDKVGMKDCADLYLEGEEDSGIYKVSSLWNPNKSFYVYCDMHTDGGGWTLIQRQGTPGFSKDYFQRSWSDYKQGFGDLTSDFWLGNENILSITNQGAYSLRFDFGERQREDYVVYDTFWIEDETKKYKLHVEGYDASGSAGDVFSDHNGVKFSTFDAKNTDGTQCGYNGCSKDCTTPEHQNSRGWWHTKDCKIDGKLKFQTTLKRPHHNHKFKGVEMKIRPVHFQRSKENLN